MTENTLCYHYLHNHILSSKVKAIYGWIKNGMIGFVKFYQEGSTINMASQSIFWVVQVQKYVSAAGSFFQPIRFLDLVFYFLAARLPVCRSVGRSVRPLVSLSVRRSVRHVCEIVALMVNGN